MSRSYKKPWTWISKRSDRYAKKSLRQKHRKTCEEAIDFDPDKDYILLGDKSAGDRGTKLGWELEPGFDNTWWHEQYERAKRK